MNKKREKVGTRIPENSLSLEDRCLWAEVTSNVRPLKNECNQFDMPRKKNKPKERIQKSIPKIQINAPNYAEREITRVLKHGQAPGLDTRSKMRLRRGQINIEARIDLHGKTQSEAHRSLFQFIETSYSIGHRAILVITGKGLRASGNHGVLRRVIPDWLNELPLRNWIKAFDYATTRDGGEGALYILLRRRK